jgi:hypothetical protein
MAIGGSARLVLGYSHAWSVGGDALVADDSDLCWLVRGKRVVNYASAPAGALFGLAGSLNARSPLGAMVGRGRGRFAVIGERAVGGFALVVGACRP